MTVVAVFGSSRTLPTDDDYRDAERLGLLLGTAGYAVVTGGYGGTMEAVSAGASAAGGRVIGVTAPSVFPGRTGANRFVNHEETADTISQRIQRLVDMADAHVALPGSLGTVTELLVAWNDGFVAPMSGRTAKPLIAVGSGWDRLVEVLTSTYDADPAPLTLAGTVEDVVPALDARFGLAPGAAGG